MTIQEFNNRTGVNVTFEEFTHIHEVYMSSDCDKDAFCKLWVKMNSKRVAEAKEARAREKEEQERKEVAFYIFHKLHNVRDYAPVSEVLCPRDLSYISNILGFSLMEPNWIGGMQEKTSLTIFCELGKYCGALR